MALPATSSRSLWLAAVGVTMLSYVCVVLMDLRGNWLHDARYDHYWSSPVDFVVSCAVNRTGANCGWMSPTPVQDMLLWVIPAAITAGLLVWNRALLLAYLGSRVLVLLFDVVFIFQVVPFDRKGCEECFASAVLAVSSDAVFVLMLPIALLWAWAGRRLRHHEPPNPRSV